MSTSQRLTPNHQRAIGWQAKRLFASHRQVTSDTNDAAQRPPVQRTLDAVAMAAQRAF
jgi:hypothetical protein